jgi:hypothetical protein
VALGLQSFQVTEAGRNELRVRRLLTAVPILLLAVLEAPLQARALLFEFLPSDFLALGASEPVMLLLTGLTLLSLSRVGSHGSRSESVERRVVVMPAPDVVTPPQPVASVQSAKRAA